MKPRMNWRSRFAPASIGANGIRFRIAALLVTLFAGLGIAPTAIAQTQVAVEYYYAAWDYYFETSFPDEIAVLDGGAFGGVWKRTGQTFNVWSQPVSGASATCRFFSTAFAPKSSHFYTPFASECATVKNNPDWQFEAIAFYLQLPDASGTCPMGTTVLYRLYNNGMGGAPNHRYTTSLTIFNQMQAVGWIFEGNGLTRAFACVPQGAAAATAEGLWTGSTNTNERVYGIVLETGKFYFLYTFPGTSNIAGFVQGNGTSANGLFSASDARDFSLAGLGVNNATISGTYAPRATLSGAISSALGSTTFSSAYQIEYEMPASLAQIAGSFAGGFASSSAGSQAATVSISPSGAVSGNSSGCTFSGTATPHGSVNVLDLSVTFSGGACIFGASAFQGGAYYDVKRRELTAVAQNALRTEGFLLFGAKPF